MFEGWASLFWGWGSWRVQCAAACNRSGFRGLRNAPPPVTAAGRVLARRLQEPLRKELRPRLQDVQADSTQRTKGKEEQRAGSFILRRECAVSVGWA